MSFLGKEMREGPGFSSRDRASHPRLSQFLFGGIKSSDPAKRSEAIKAFWRGYNLALLQHASLLAEVQRGRVEGLELRDCQLLHENFEVGYIEILCGTIESAERLIISSPFIEHIRGQPLAVLSIPTSCPFGCTSFEEWGCVRERAFWIASSRHFALSFLATLERWKAERVREGHVITNVTLRQHSIAPHR